MHKNDNISVTNKLFYEVQYFSEAVRQEILTLPLNIRLRVFALLERMETYGGNLGMPHTRALGEGLFELRAKAFEGIGRVFYCMKIGRRIIILHSFVKKTEKTPSKEIDIARNRMKEVENAG